MGQLPCFIFCHCSRCIQYCGQVWVPGYCCSSFSVPVWVPDIYWCQVLLPGLGPKCQVSDTSSQDFCARYQIQPGIVAMYYCQKWVPVVARFGCKVPGIRYKQGLFCSTYQFFCEKQYCCSSFFFCARYQFFQSSTEIGARFISMQQQKVSVA